MPTPSNDAGAAHGGAHLLFGQAESQRAHAAYDLAVQRQVRIELDQHRAQFGFFERGAAAFNDLMLDAVDVDFDMLRQRHHFLFNEGIERRGKTPLAELRLEGLQVKINFLLERMAGAAR